MAAETLPALDVIFGIMPLAGFTDAMIAGASFQNALLAGIAGGALSAVGVALVPAGGFANGFEAAAYAAKIGVVGGIGSVLQGGRFGDGSRSAGISSLTGSVANSLAKAMDLKAFGQSVARIVAGGTASALTGGKFANGAAYAAFAAAVQSLAQDHVAVTGGKNLSRKELAKLRKNAATPEFYDKNGNPLGEHLSLDEALQAGEDASRAAAAASGTDNEYGVATIKGSITADGVQTYYNSAPVTSNSPYGIAWNTAGLKGSLVALNHLHPGDNLGFSPEDRKAYKSFKNRGYGELQGVYMFDGLGNHWYGPEREIWSWWIFRGSTRTHSCGGASAKTWACPSF